MRLNEIYKKDINRDITGVIKVGQEDVDAVYQELDEYVVTEEILRYIDKFFTAYAKGIDNRTSAMGTWISGFFGSGKSHFLKILSYLLANKEIKDKRAITFFEDKIEDKMILAEMQKAGSVPTDVILFNIDAKSSENSATKDTILSVFEKVFNEVQGYSAVSYIANFERELDKKGKLDDFKNVFEELNGETWIKGRNDFFFNQDDIVEALTKVLDMSIESARNYVEKMEESYEISIEEFATRVQEYIERKGNNRHVVFLVDEVGQYIGDDSKLMLNLQTITEELGIHCGGKAWVIVTSQQAIDEVTKVVGDDFSKITGRFDTRISFSSANVDEVIKKRLLEKTDVATETLKQVYYNKESVLKNLITFTNSAEMKNYSSDEEFAKVYPFVPYQMNLLQKIFNGVRIHGASGKHLSEGARSLLGAFKEVAMLYKDKEIGFIVPLSSFYDTIEQFLDHNIKIVIEQAKTNSRLEAYDIEILKVLFMVKYIKELPSTIENIAVLMVDSIDADKINIKKNIEESLKRLARETLIQKNGQEYIFLTNEEQDINKEIKNMNVTSEERYKALYSMIFDDILGIKRYRYNNKYDFSLNQYVDDHQYNAREEILGIKVLTSYQDLDETSIRLKSAQDNNVTLILNINSIADEDLENILKIEAYLRQKGGIDRNEEVESIINAKNREVVKTKDRLREEIREIIKTGDIYIKGEKKEVGIREPNLRINEALEMLVKSIYTKIDYVKKFYEKKDLIDLFNNDKSQITLEKEEHTTNSYKEVETALDIWFRQNLPVTIKNVLNKFQGVPYGWREEDIFAEVIKLLKDENIKLQMSGEVLLVTDRTTLDTLLNRQNFDRIRVEIRKKLDINLINNVKSISKSVFNKSNLPEDEDTLKEEFKKTISKELFSLNEILGRYLGRRVYQYPCKNELETYMKLLNNINDIRDTEEFYNYVFDKREELNTLSNKMVRVKSFFENQVALFDKLADKIIVYTEENNKYNAFSDKLNNVANQIIEILEMAEPFDRIPDLSMLEQDYVKEIVDILEKEAEPRIKKLEIYKQEIHNELENKNLISEFANRFSKEFDDVKETLEKVNKMDTILSADAWIENLKDEWYKRINLTLEKKALEQQKETEEAVEVVVKKTRYIKVSDVVPKTNEIKSKEDIENVIDIIRDNLIKALNEGQDIKLI